MTDDELKRARELADSYEQTTGWTEMPVVIRALADEVERLQSKERKEMDDDLAWALKGKLALMEQVEKVWRPLLENYKVDHAALHKFARLARVEHKFAGLARVEGGITCKHCEAIARAEEVLK